MEKDKLSAKKLIELVQGLDNIDHIIVENLLNDKAYPGQKIDTLPINCLSKRGRQVFKIIMENL